MKYQMTNPTLHKIWIIGSVAALAMFGSIAAVNWHHVAYMEKTAEVVARTEHVNTELRELLLSVVDIETAQRGYLLTGDPAFLQPLEEAVKRLPAQQLELESLLSDAEQKARLSAVWPLIAERIAVTRSLVQTRRDSGFEAALQQHRTLDGKRLTDEIRAQLAQMNDRAQVLLDERSAEARRAAQSVRVFTFSGTTATFALLAVVFALLLRQNRLRREAEVQRDGFFNFGLDLFSVAGPDGYFRQVNSAFRRTLGWSTEETLARPMIDFVHPDDRAATISEVEKLAAGQQSLHFENRYQCKDGSWKTLEWRTVQQPDGTLYAAARDVTEMRAATTALRATEERLTVTLHSIGDAVLATDTLRCITELNPVAEKLTGWTRAEALGRPVEEVFNIISEETRLPAPNPVEDVLATGEIRGLANHTAIIARDGTERSIADSAAPIHDRAGRILGVVMVFRDVTAEYAAQRALRESDALNRTVLNSIMADLAVVDRHGTIIAVNNDWERSARDDGSDLSLSGVGVGVNYLNVFERAAQDRGEEAEPILEGLRGVLAGSNKSFKHEYSCHSPCERRWYVTTISPLSREEGGAVIAHADITARKRAEQVLADFKAALDEHAIVAITDARGNITYVNDKFCAISKYAREELLGQDHLALISSHHPKGFIRELRQAITSGRVWHGEIKSEAKDGSYYWLSTTIVPFFGADGKPSQYIAIRSDITRRKQAEERVQRLNADMQVRAAELEAANKELESFSYSVSHDLRAPLRHIHGYVEMLGKATDGQLSEKAGRYLKVIAAASEEMGQLIDDLLAFSRMGRAEMWETAVDLDQLVQQTIGGLEMATSDRNIIWNIAPLPPGTGDPAMLKQVFSNLIGNAVKYSRQREPAEIEIGCAGEENGRTVYFVRDNGAGFDMRYAHKLFGVFQRLHRAEEFEGTGIGLASVRRLLARHGDRIWAEGEIDKGATFYFTLKPAAAARSDQSPENQEITSQ